MGEGIRTKYVYARLDPISIRVVKLCLANVVLEKHPFRTSFYSFVQYLTPGCAGFVTHERLPCERCLIKTLAKLEKLSLHAII
jgi:hypothetical protein